MEDAREILPPKQAVLLTPMRLLQLNKNGFLFNIIWTLTVHYNVFQTYYSTVASAGSVQILFCKMDLFIMAIRRNSQSDSSKMVKTHLNAKIRA